MEYHVRYMVHVNVEANSTQEAMTKALEPDAVKNADVISFMNVFACEKCESVEEEKTD